MKKKTNNSKLRNRNESERKGLEERNKKKRKKKNMRLQPRSRGRGSTEDRIPFVNVICIPLFAQADSTFHTDPSIMAASFLADSEPFYLLLLFIGAFPGP